VFVDASLLDLREFSLFYPERPFLVSEVKASRPESCKRAGIPVAFSESVAFDVQLLPTAQLRDGFELVLMGSDPSKSNGKRRCPNLTADVL
jgi:hypothetical protein